VKKISLLPSDQDCVDLVITMTKTDHPAEPREIGRLAMERLKAEKGPGFAIPRVRMGILAAATNAYLGHVDVSCANSTPEPVEGFHFDPANSRVLYRNPPKKAKEKRKKIEKYDPWWAKAKKLCRLNQEEIRMAKELGMGPRSLLRNIPSAKQQWKLPVNLWIREQYEKKHPGKGFEQKKSPAMGRRAPAAPLIPDLPDQLFFDNDYTDGDVPF
jgi:hypothetical protein